MQGLHGVRPTIDPLSVVWTTVKRALAQVGPLLSTSLHVPSCMTVSCPSRGLLTRCAGQPRSKMRDAKSDAGSPRRADQPRCREVLPAQPRTHLRWIASSMLGQAENNPPVACQLVMTPTTSA